MKLGLLCGIALVTGLFAAPFAGGRVQDAPKPADPPKPKESGLVYVLMKTSAGDIAIELNRDKAPISVDNFLAYADKGFYEGTIFHRVISDFMIQGGGYTPDQQLKPTDKPIRNEGDNGLKNTKGSLAMARLGGKPDSATSQFFINVKDNPGLDQKADGASYAVFGRVVEGMNVVDTIKNAPTKESAPPRSEKSVPISPVKIEKVTRMTPEQVASLKQRTAAKS